MATNRVRRTGPVALGLIGLLVIVGLSGCATTIGGTAAVAPDAAPRSSVATTTESATDTTRPTKPTPQTTESTVESSTVAPTPTPASVTARPTDAAGAPVPSAPGLLFVGDCYTVTAGDVSSIDCAELHVGQVAKTDVALPGVDPAKLTADPWLQAANSACAVDFATFIGSSTDRYSQSFVITSPPGGPPVVACTVVDVSGEQWAGSAESISGSYFGIDVGDCFDYPTAQIDAAEIPCDQSHDAEMYVLDAPLGLDLPESPYPTDQEWQDISVQICIGPFADYTGQSYESALDLGYTFVYPLQPDWSDVSQRKLSCAITSIDGTKLVGSRRA